MYKLGGINIRIIHS